MNEQIKEYKQIIEQITKKQANIETTTNEDEYEYNEDDEE